MNVLTEIHRHANLDIHGRADYRTAVRGVSLRGRKLLMIRSAEVGDYKFPGGGVDDGETHQQTLRREIREECGLSLLRFGAELGTVVEYIRPLHQGFDVFIMTSYYYLCEVDNNFGAQNLDEYEKELGFEPVWIDIDETLQANKSLLAGNHPPGWLGREIFVLEFIRQHLL